MAPRRPPTPPHPLRRSGSEEEESLPTVTTVGLAPSGRGWVVVVVEVQGDRVIERDVVSVAPESKGVAARRALAECVKQWMRPERGVSA